MNIAFRNWTAHTSSGLEKIILVPAWKAFSQGLAYVISEVSMGAATRKKLLQCYPLVTYEPQQCITWKDIPNDTIEMLVY